MTTREALLDQLDRAHREFVAMLEGLDERAFDRKWLDNRWGAREVVAHLTGWHGLLASGLERMSRGERPVPEGEDWTDTQHYNDIFAEHTKGKKKAEVLHELDAAIESFHHAALKLPEERYSEGSTARKMFDAAGIRHFGEHTQMLRDWRASEELRRSVAS